MVLDSVLKKRPNIFPEFVKLIMETEDFKDTYELIEAEFKKQLKNRPKLHATIEYLATFTFNDVVPRDL